MSRARLVVLASGSGTLLQALIDAAASGEVPADIVAVGSDVADAPALDRARIAGLPTFALSPRDFGSRADWDAALLNRVRESAPDWIVTAGFMRILAPSFVDAFPERIINSHPALLPAFPGAHAVQAALDAGVPVTGCTVHFVDQGVDTGPVIAQREVAILPDDDPGTLHERIKAVERPLLVATVARLTGGAS